MHKILIAIAALTFMAPAGARDLWEKTDAKLQDLLAEGYRVFDHTVDSGVDVYSGTTVTYLLEIPNQVPQKLALCVKEGRKHQCFTMKVPA